MYAFIKQETKNAITKKMIIFTLIIILVNSVIVYIMNTNNFLSPLLISIVSNMSNILIFSSSEILSKDFLYNTYKLVYTGKYSRSKIILLKLITMIIVSIICAIIGSILSIWAMYVQYKIINFESIIKIVLNLQKVFILYTLIIASTSFLILGITKNFLATVSTVYIIFFNLLTPFILNAINKIQNSNLKSILKNIPYLYATQGAKQLYYSIKETYIIIVFSLIVIGITIYIFERQDL